MEPQFKELSKQIAQEVTAAVTSAVNARVTEVVSAAEQRLAHQAQQHRDELTAHVTGAVTSAEQRLAHQAQVNVEAVKYEAKLAAEGYAATLQSIERRMERIETRLDTQSAQYDAVLNNHHQRITTLEQHR